MKILEMTLKFLEKIFVNTHIFNQQSLILLNIFNHNKGLKIIYYFIFNKI